MGRRDSHSLTHLLLISELARALEIISARALESIVMMEDIESIYGGIELVRTPKRTQTVLYKIELVIW